MLLEAFRHRSAHAANDFPRHSPRSPPGSSLEALQEALQETPQEISRNCARSSLCSFEGSRGSSKNSRDPSKNSLRQPDFGTTCEKHLMKSHVLFWKSDATENYHYRMANVTCSRYCACAQRLSGANERSPNVLIQTKNPTLARLESLRKHYNRYGGTQFRMDLEELSFTWARGYNVGNI